MAAWKTEALFCVETLHWFFFPFPFLWIAPDSVLTCSRRRRRGKVMEWSWEQMDWEHRG